MTPVAGTGVGKKGDIARSSTEAAGPRQPAAFRISGVCDHPDRMFMGLGEDRSSYSYAIEPGKH